MSEKMRDVIVEGFTDIFLLFVDLITAPILAICRVASDFVHRRGHYSHMDRDSPDPN